MKKYLFVIFALLSLTLVLQPFQGYAQMQKMPKGYNLEKFKKDAPKLLSSNNAGTDFWCTFHPCVGEAQSGDKIYIYVSSNAKTTVTIEVPGKNYHVQQSTIPNDIIAFEIDPAIAQPYLKKDTTKPKTEQIFTGAGIHVYADQPILVYGVFMYDYASDSFLALPVSALGMDYIASSWPDEGDNGIFIGYLTSYTEVIAAFDQTTVYFTLGGTSSTKTAGGMKPGETMQWKLYKGDVLIVGNLGLMGDLTGSRWSASKPVACFSGSFGADVPENVDYIGYLIEEELPTSTWGKTYFYTPIAGRLKNSYIRIIAKEDNTKVYKDGQILITLKHGGGLQNDGWLSVRADNASPKPIVFSADNPINVIQYNTGMTDDNVASEPFQMSLTPLEQFQNEITFNTLGTLSGKGFKTNWINLVCKTNADGSLPDDLMIGYIQNGQFAWQSLNTYTINKSMSFSIPVNGNKYACEQLLLPVNGIYKIKANDPFCVYSYGFASNESYGHPASVGLKDLEKNDTIPPHITWFKDCNGTIWKDSTMRSDPVVEDFPQNGNRSYIAEINFNPDSSFNYKFSYKDFIPGIDALTTWKASVQDSSKDARLVVTFSDRDGNDTTITINYFISKFKMNPNVMNFGLINKGDTLTKNVWLVNHSTTAGKVIKNVFLKGNNQGYRLLSKDMTIINLPFTLPANDSVKIKIQFTNSTSGNYADTISICDDCNTFSLCNLKSQVGECIIEATDTTFNDTYLGSTTTSQLTIYNRGVFELTINGFQKPDTTVFEVHLPEINNDQLLTISPQDLFSFYVTFKPQAEKEYLDSIVFSSNASIMDSVCILKGKGLMKSGINDNNISNEINYTLYPNPVEDILTIHFNNEINSNNPIKILDIFGNLIDELNYYYQNINYNTSKLANGLYIIQLNTGNKLVTKTFMILR
ncbi:MAG: T9SS type A sorting domain-containing protein [FCB group bacterium]